MFILKKETLEILDINDAAINTYGYDKDTFTDKRLPDLLSPELTTSCHSTEEVDIKAEHITGNHIHETAFGTLLPVKLLVQPLEYSHHDAYLVKAISLQHKSDYQWAIDQTEQELKEHLANSPLAYMIWDDKFHLKRISPEITEWLDVSRDELLGERSTALAFSQLTAHDFMRVKKKVDNLFEEETTNNIMEFGVQISEDETRYLKLYNSALKDAEGNLVSVLSLVENQTQLVNSLKLQELQNEIIQNASDFVCLIGMDGNIKYLNPAGRRLMGFDEDFDITSTYIKKFFTDESYHRLVSTLIPKAVENGSWKEELELRTLDGKKIPVSTVISVHKDENDNIEYYSTISRDISKERRILSDLRNKTQQLEAAMQGGEVCFWQYFVEEDRFEFDHDWLHELLGYENQNLADFETWKKLIHPEDWPAASQHFLDTIKGETDSFKDELRLQKADGEYLWILSKGKPVEYDDRGNPTKISGVHLDIDDWK
ncbi:PAS domain S-box protein [Aliifodinibius halophilus]|uniref:histidine kinase n=2 Tax=Fodinibius halophilus TaxID=1736908 RepID=A0A6M1T9B6_9BACT|nr:PAS domain S-box protein [Fodinibius halophilus]